MHDRKTRPHIARPSSISFSSRVSLLFDLRLEFALVRKLLVDLPQRQRHYEGTYGTRANPLGLKIDLFSD